MASLNACWILLTVVSLQGILDAHARPSCIGGGCGGEIEYGYGGSKGKFGGGFAGGYGGGIGNGYGPAVAPMVPIPCLPVPQAVPGNIPSFPSPSPPRQSVTIPNIILALLPPTNKPAPASAPKPVQHQYPMACLLPQPYPVPVPSPCGC